MAYNPLVPTGLDTNLIPKEVRAQYFKEVLTSTNLSRFMGGLETDAIQMFNKKEGTGDTYTVSFSPPIDYLNPIVGNFAQIEGKGQTIKFFSDSVTLVKRAFIAKEPGIVFMKLDTPIDVYNSLKPKLIEGHARSMTHQILAAATVIAYPTTATGPTVDRVIYGSKAFNATIQGGVDSMTGGSAYNQDGVSVAGIRKLALYCEQGGASYEAEKRISPIKMSERGGVWTTKFILLLDSVAYLTLEGDPDWKNYYYRGVIEGANQPSGLNASRFKGSIDTVDIYTVPELAKFRQKSTDLAVTVAWNLLIGAQAWMLVWGKQPWFNMKLTNMNNDVEMDVEDIRGQKSLMFESYKTPGVNIENGIIHYFTSVVGLV